MKRSIIVLGLLLVGSTQVKSAVVAEVKMSKLPAVLPAVEEAWRAVEFKKVVDMLAAFVTSQLEMVKKERAAIKVATLEYPNITNKLDERIRVLEHAQKALKMVSAGAKSMVEQLTPVLFSPLAVMPEPWKQAELDRVRAILSRFINDKVAEVREWLAKSKGMPFPDVYPNMVDQMKEQLRTWNRIIKVWQIMPDVVAISPMPMPAFKRG